MQKKETSPTLLKLIIQLVSKGKTSKHSLSLSQSTQRHISHRNNAATLGLDVKLYHRFGSRGVVGLLNDYGFVVSYDEVLRFRASAAKYTADKGPTAHGLGVNDKQITAWIDNYDLNVFTPNGNR